jgi:twinkle protein
MSLTEYVGFAIREFRRLAKRLQVCVIVAAHPAKMHREKNGEYPVPSLYDISDSAHWANKPEIGVVVYRASEDETVLRLVKSRYHEILGQPGDYSARYSRHDKRFVMLPKDAPAQAEMGA